MPLSTRAIVQCTKEGIDIKSFSSASAACKELGIRYKAHIYRAIKYGLVAYGYRWRWADEPLNELQDYGMRLKPVIARKDDVDKEYSNIVIASHETGASPSHIQQAILTGGKAKGYYFRLVGTDPKPIAKGTIKRKAIVALDDKGNIVKRWLSVQDAAKDLGVIVMAVYRAANPKHPNAKCKGYRIRYVEE